MNDGSLTLRATVPGTVFSMAKYLFIVAFVVFASSCTERAPRNQLCGGAMRSPCPIGFYCELGDTCGGLDKVGVCTLVPETCPQADAQAIVCGCDNTEYTSTCVAHTLGVSVQHPGPCIRTPKIKSL